MSKEDLRKIKEMAENHTISPRPQAWDRLEHMMEASPKPRPIWNMKYMSIAAVFLVLVSVVSVFTLLNTSHDPQVFASNEEFRPVILEELPHEDDPFYNVENVAAINAAYSRAGF